MIERTFILKNETKSDIDKVSLLINEIPIDYVMLSDTILKLAEKNLSTEFSLGMLVSLSDHIFSAVERHKKEIQTVTPLHWSIKQLYPNEVELGEMVVREINQAFQIQLEDSESTSIAMHFISNGTYYDSIQQAMNFTKIISDIISIIQYHFHFKVDQESISFSRFISHLQYFLIRQIRGIEMKEMTDDMMSLIISQYQSSFQCAEKIVNYLSKNYRVTPSLAEEIYLTMHVERIVKAEEVT